MRGADGAELAPVRVVGQQVDFSLLNVYKLIRKSRLGLRKMCCPAAVVARILRNRRLRALVS
jgi:hypothetical protein